jgi:hypothetical protein
LIYCQIVCDLTLLTPQYALLLISFLTNFSLDLTDPLTRRLYNYIHDLPEIPGPPLNEYRTAYYYLYNNRYILKKRVENAMKIGLKTQPDPWPNLNVKNFRSKESESFKLLQNPIMLEEKNVTHHNIARHELQEEKNNKIVEPLEKVRGFAGFIDYSIEMPIDVKLEYDSDLHHIIDYSIEGDAVSTNETKSTSPIEIKTIDSVVLNSPLVINELPPPKDNIESNPNKLDDIIISDILSDLKIDTKLLQYPTAISLQTDNISATPHVEELKVRVTKKADDSQRVLNLEMVLESNEIMIKTMNVLNDKLQRKLNLSKKALVKARESEAELKKMVQDSNTKIALLESSKASIKQEEPQAKTELALIKGNIDQMPYHEKKANKGAPKRRIPPSIYEELILEYLMSDNSVKRVYHKWMSVEDLECYKSLNIKKKHPNLTSLALFKAAKTFILEDEKKYLEKVLKADFVWLDLRKKIKSKRIFTTSSELFNNGSVILVDVATNKTKRLRYDLWQKYASVLIDVLIKFDIVDITRLELSQSE